MSKNRKELSPPELELDADLPQFRGNLAEVDVEYHRQAFIDVAWSGKSVTKVQFDAALFQRTDLSKSRLRDVVFRDVRVSGCDWSNANCIGIKACRVEVSSSRLTGFNGAEGKFEHTLFRGCTIDLSTFQSAKLYWCKFEKCKLAGASFDAADLKHVVFQDCDLMNARFFKSKLQDVDLRGSRLDGLGLSIGDLSGVTIDLLQAPTIALLTGLKIIG